MAYLFNSLEYSINCIIFECYYFGRYQKVYFNHGYIDVGDGCWRPNVLVTHTSHIILLPIGMSPTCRKMSPSYFFVTNILKWCLALNFSFFGQGFWLHTFVFRIAPSTLMGLSGSRLPFYRVFCTHLIWTLYSLIKITFVYKFDY